MQKVMTEQEMKKRMKEIDEERDKLKKEKEEYESYFSNKKKGEEINQRKALEGKCFVSADIKTRFNDKGYIKAFRILNVLEHPNECSAECLVLIDGFRSSCWAEYGIQIMTLGLWYPNQLRLKNNPEDPKMIDLYKEISEQEFFELYRRYGNSLDDKVGLVDFEKEIILGKYLGAVSISTGKKINR